MCFDYHALPPLPPVTNLPPLFAQSGGATAAGEHIELVSADGTHFAAYQTTPHQPNGAAIVIIPDIRGLFRFYEELAERFASVGVAALTIDYFGRTAGVSTRTADFDFMPHLVQTKMEQIAQDVAAAVTQLRQTVQPRAIYTVGFCFGGQQSFFQAAQPHGLSGVIGFYGPPTTNRFGGPAPIDLLAQFTCPILGLYGGADPGIPVADVETFATALTAANLEHQIKIYAGAPHSFFDRSAATHQQESADAWQQMLTFIDRYTPKSAI